MEYKDILDNIQAEHDKFIYKYGIKPNILFINYTVMRTLMMFEKFREIVTIDNGEFSIIGLKVYETLDKNTFIKVALIEGA